jgi:predicted phosphohydrolase
MTSVARIALTADLHWGHRKGGEAVRLLASFVRHSPPDLLILAGDIGTGRAFEECLALFADLPCRKALVPGNHDVWVLSENAPHDSLAVYEQVLPALAARYDFHYLDHGPLILPGADLAIVGTINWYDYSWGVEGIRRFYPDEEGRLRSKRFNRGRHNDANFVRWQLDDGSFTARIVERFEGQLLRALGQVSRVIVVTHHPPFYGLGFARPGPPVELDSFLWDAFCGNRAMEEVLGRHAERIAFAFCGHTHQARENRLGGIRGYNIGGDYHFKRLLMLDWPAGRVEAREFGNVE